MDNREGWIARTFVELADTLVADFDVIDLASRLVERCGQLLGATEVGLALSARDKLRVVASSSERMGALELMEFEHDEGPGYDCVRTGHSVLNQHLDHAYDRWPRFTLEARSAGFEIVHALPLRLRHDVIGVMNIFGSNQRDLSTIEVDLAQALADIATIGILQERAISSSASIATQLRSALNSRLIVEQAKGVVTEARDVGADEAFAMLLRYARAKQLRLSVVASAVIDRTLSASVLPLVTRWNGSYG